MQPADMDMCNYSICEAEVEMGYIMDVRLNMSVSLDANVLGLFAK
jgi:hypothetical protein